MGIVWPRPASAHSLRPEVFVIDAAPGGHPVLVGDAGIFVGDGEHFVWFR